MSDAREPTATNLAHERVGEPTKLRGLRGRSARIFRGVQMRTGKHSES